jgi:hypothetical protein
VGTGFRDGGAVTGGCGVRGGVVRLARVECGLDWAEAARRSRRSSAERFSEWGRNNVGCDRDPGWPAPWLDGRTYVVIRCLGRGFLRC